MGQTEERKQARLKEVIQDEGNAILKMAGEIDYSVLSRITELLCSVKKNSKKVILAGCGTAGMGGQAGCPHAVCRRDSRIFSYHLRIRSTAEWEPCSREIS